MFTRRCIAHTRVCVKTSPLFSGLAVLINLNFTATKALGTKLSLLTSEVGVCFRLNQSYNKWTEYCRTVGLLGPDDNFPYVNLR